MGAQILAFMGVLAAGLLVALPGYHLLLRRIEREHPAEFERLGRPSLFNRSLSQSIALQRFIYAGSRSKSIAPAVARLCRFLAVLTPLYLAALLLGLVRLFASIGGNA
jgi:hypothetical protein